MVTSRPVQRTPQKNTIKDGVTHKSPLVIVIIVKLVVNQFSLNVKRAKS